MSLATNNLDSPKGNLITLSSSVEPERWSDGEAMPFRHGYEGLFDDPTRAALQEVFESVWQVVLDTNPGPITESEVAAIIIKAHNAGMKPEAIKEALVRALELRQQRML